MVLRFPHQTDRPKVRARARKPAQRAPLNQATRWERQGPPVDYNPAPTAPPPAASADLYAKLAWLFEQRPHMYDVVHSMVEHVLVKHRTSFNR